MALHGAYKYPGNVALDMAAILEEGATGTSYLWNACFGKETLVREVESAGFKARAIYGDVAGKVYARKATRWPSLRKGHTIINNNVMSAS